MDSLAISWLAASATSPLVAVLALWTIYVFHSYRRRWRTVDLFLLTIACQELINASCIFCFAILNLIRHPALACTSIQFVQVSSRTFQLAALASMVVDRALTVRWPYRYRFSVRRNQIRYHVAVLALVSCLVGVASVFARVQDIENACRLHPAEWDVRYTVFLLCLYGALVVVWCVCMVQTEVHRSRDGSFQLPECASPDLPTGGMNSPLDTQSSTGSTRALHRPSRQASRRPYARDNKGTSDLRWPSVAFVSLLCFLLNHLPYLVLMGLAAWNPRLWSPWHEVVISWLGLVEGLLVPLLLFCRDPALKAALRRAFQRRSGALSPLVGDDGPFQMYFDKDHFRKRGTFGSVTPIGIITNYRRTPGSGGCRDSSKNKRRVGKYTLPGLNGDSVLPKSCFLSGGGVGGEPLSKLSCADLTSLEMWREEDEENFYATLSDDFSTFSCKSGDDSALSEDLRISEELYGGSFTTVANDDFEFHDTRPCGGEVRMKPALVSPATPPSRHTSFNKGNIRPKINLPKVFPEESRTTPNFISTVQETAEDHKDPNLFILPPKEWQNDSLAKIGEEMDLNSTRTDPSREFIKRQHQPQKSSTSYSMNDLDLIHKNILPPEATSFILPVKSESTMSLYRLNVDQDVDQMMMMTPSKSENNVNGDSGFGSGAQSTNPVWSGFLCRKPSDPFWNMRKPTTNSTTPTRNYPGMLHPRMRKIPWISAWRKLDENSIHNERRRRAKESTVDDDIGWKENLVYESNVPNNPSAGVIPEELLDVGSPVCNSNYALDIFAKESGVLMENAYGKIVRDDSGVQVNFYTKGSQHDDARGAGVNHFSAINKESNGLDIRNKSDGQPHHHGVSELPSSEIRLLPSDCTEKMLPIESIFLDRNPLLNDGRHKPEGHYENLFGAHGINYGSNFALCEPRFEKKEPVQDVWFENQTSRDESSRGIRSIPVFSKEAAYGQLNRLEKLTSNGSKKSPLKSRELRRRESDNRSNRSSNRRRESRNRSDPRPNFILESNAYTSFAQLGNRLEDSAKASSDKNNVEIEMKNVYVRKDFQPESRLEGYGNQNCRHRDISNEPSRTRFESNGELLAKGKQVAPVERRDSRNKVRDMAMEQRSASEQKHENGYPRKTNALRTDLDSSNKSNLRTANVAAIDYRKDRKSSGVPVRIERKSSDRIEKKLSPKHDFSRNKRCDNKNEGLWANAAPFKAESSQGSKDDENGNSPRRDSVKEKHSPRKSKLPRKESDKSRVRRKVSANRGRTERSAELNNASDVRDDFHKLRDKCEDNFSHIKNLNRETSSERGISRLDQMIFYGKLNGNTPQQNGDVYPCETGQENGRKELAGLSRDDNENCRETQLAIADFL